MSQLFVSTGYLDAESLAQTIPMQKLPAFLRVLLTTDGTVTKSLESYFWEPVRVHNCGQSYTALKQSAPMIHANQGSKVLRRSVKLVGEQSNTCYAVAVSLIRTEFLDAHLRASLEVGQVGIGELLRECGLETYREIMAIGEGNQGEPLADTESIWRTYRIVMAHQPFIQITEFFPCAAFR